MVTKLRKLKGVKFPGVDDHDEEDEEEDPEESIQQEEEEEKKIIVEAEIEEEETESKLDDPSSLFDSDKKDVEKSKKGTKQDSLRGATAISQISDDLATKNVGRSGTLGDKQKSKEIAEKNRNGSILPSKDSSFKNPKDKKKKDSGSRK